MYASLSHRFHLAEERADAAKVKENDWKGAHNARYD
jgi:hypothetical protein